MDSAAAMLILIGVGSNIQPLQNVQRGGRLLRDVFPAARLSTFYHTRPLGGREQPPYINGVVAAMTHLRLAEVRTALRSIERQCGRVRDPHNRYAPRTLDLDLLAYGDAVLANEGLPAADLLERDFCLVPAAELLPDWIHPRAGRTLRDLAAERFPQPPHLIGPVDIRLG